MCLDLKLIISGGFNVLKVNGHYNLIMCDR